MNFDREMQKALEADGEKLRQLTGEDHGPVFECESEKTHILWCTNMDDDGYADILFLVGDKPPYSVGINCGGHVIIKPLREWHALAFPPAQRGDAA